jgi:hypothetical protein
MGDIAHIKIKNNRDKVVLHYDFDEVIDNIVIDKSGNDNNGIMNGCKIKKEVVDKIPFTVVPHRRFSKFECLFHEDEGIVKGNFVSDTTPRNERIYKLKMQQKKIDIDTDEYGVKNMEYELVSIEDCYNYHKMVNVKF